MDFKQITDKFKPSKMPGLYICPSHKDNKASLSIKYDASTQRTLIYCHAGCSTKDILDSIGLTFADLGSNSKSREQYSNIEDQYPYTDKNGNLLYIKIRNKDIVKYGKFSLIRYVDGKTLWALSAGKYTETYPGSNNYSPRERPGAKELIFNEQPKVLYNLPNLINAIENEFIVYICEGEKDCNTMRRLGFIATTPYSGAGKGEKKWSDNYSKYFAGAKVVILSDNDDTGKEFAKTIQRKLQNYAHATKIINISDKPKGDITDWIGEGHTKEEFQEIEKDIQWKYAPWIYEKNNKGDKGVNQGIIADCIRKTLQYKLIGNPASNKVMIFIYSNGRYKEISKKTLNKYINKYIPKNIVSNSLLNNVSDLLTNDDIEPYIILNGKKDIINLKNGLYNPKTNEFKPHDPNYISSIQLDVEYNPGCKNNGYWDNFIKTLTQNDNDLINIIQEFFGLILSNYDASIVKKLFVLYGVGNTGKSKVIEILLKLLGDGNSTSIPIQNLGERFALGSIFKSRLIHDGDLPSKAIDDGSLTKVKTLTGGDPISIEKKGLDTFDINYRGAMMYACNELPIIKGDLGNHVFKRFLVIPCNNPIPVDKQDKDLINKLLKDNEYIFIWSMEGLRRLISNGYNFTTSIKSEEVNYQYSLKSDSVRGFINELYDITDDRKDRIKATLLYSKYENWCIQNGKKSCSKETFKDRLITNLNLIVKPYNGYPYYYFLKEKQLASINHSNISFATAT